MKNEDRPIKECVKALLDLVLESDSHDLIYRELCALEPDLKAYSFVAFCREFVPAKLALGCVYWAAYCAHNRIADKVISNLFFKEVMNLFGSPKSLENATRFSESLYAANADKEESPVVAITVHLFRKVGLKAIAKPDGDNAGKLNAGFEFIMRANEALKVVFEDKFDDLFYANITEHTHGRKDTK